MDESRIGQYSISVTTHPIMALVKVHFKIGVYKYLERIGHIFLRHAFYLMVESLSGAF